jgi:hypothetical protein
MHLCVCVCSADETVGAEAQPGAARLLVVATFIEDAVRIVTQWSTQVRVCISLSLCVCVHVSLSLSVCVAIVR